MRSLVKRRVTLILAVAVILAMTLTAFPIHVSLDTSSPSVIRIGFGNPASAHDEDYTCDGVEDNVQWQAALTALPASGGQLEVEAGTYYWADGDHRVTRSLDNVSIVGVGGIAFFDGDGTHPIFEAGGNRWFFSNIRTDTGGIEMGSTTNWMWLNVYDGTTYYPLLTDNIDIEDHSARHQAGGDDPIRLDDLASPEANTDLDATGSIHGLMPAADKSKLDAIEAGADVTDDVNVEAAGAVMEEDFDAYTVLVATTDDTPFALTVAQQTLVGRLTGGAIDDIAIGVADNSILQVDDVGDLSEFDYLRVTTSGVVGRTYSQVKEDLDLEIGTDIISKSTYDSHLGAADPHTVYVLETLFDADTFLYASTDNTPVATSPANVLAALSGHAGSTFSWGDQILSGVKGLLSTAESDLTIASDAVTVTQMRHAVDTESGAASDDLVNINGGGTVNLVILRAKNDGHTVVVKHGTGNIWLQGGNDISLDDLEDGIMLAWDSTNSKWFDIAAGGGGGGVDTSGTPVDNDWARFTDANTIEGLSDSETREALGLRVGVEVEAHDTDLTTIAGLAEADSTFIVGSGAGWVAENAATARASMGAQAQDSDLDTIAGLSSADSNFIVGSPGGWTVESGATVRGSLGFPADPDADRFLMWDDDPVGELVWSSIGGGDVTGPGSSTDNAITRFSGTTGKVIQDYTSNPPTISDTGDMDIDGDLDVENIVVSGTVDGVDISAHDIATTGVHGITGTILGTEDLGSTVQDWDDDLDDLAALTPTDSYFIVGDNTDWVTESGDTVRTSLGLAIGTDIVSKATFDDHSARHLVSGADTIFPTDPDADQYLMWDDVPGELVWSTPGGGGDVTGPGSATDNAIVRFDGTSGKLVQAYTSNPPTISDTGDVNIDGDLDVENIVVSGTVDGVDVSAHDIATTGVHGVTGTILGSEDIGSSVQAYDATLTSIALLGTAADKIAYTTGLDTWAETAITSLARTLLADSTAADMRSTISAQQQDAELDEIAALSDADSNFIVGSGSAWVVESGATARASLGFPGDPGSDKFLMWDDAPVGELVWSDIGGGDVTGPGASTDDAIVRFDGATGKVIQDYTSNAPTISDTGDVNIDGDLDVENIVVSGTVDGIDVSAHDTATTGVHGVGANTILHTGNLGSTIQDWDDDLDDLAALTPTDSYFIVGDNTDWVTESGDTVRTSLGLAIGTDIISKATFDDHSARHLVSGADTIFPADPDADQYLMWDDVPGELIWSTPGGGGDVTGPGSSTDNAVVRFDGTSGKLIQDYTSNPTTISDTGDMNIDGDLDVENIVVSGTVDGVDISAHDTATTGVHGITGTILGSEDIGSSVHAYDATLDSIDDLGTAANKIIYTTSIDTWAESTISSDARGLLDDADYSAMRTTLSLVIGTNVQQWDEELDELAGLSNADSNFVVGTGTVWTVESGATARASLGFPGDPDADRYLMWDDAPTGELVWSEVGTGDVTGPGSSTDDAIVRFDGVTGKIIQGYVSNPATISDTGDMNIDGDLDVENIVVSGTVDGIDISAHDTATTGVHGVGANTILHTGNLGSSIQDWDDDLDDLAALTPTDGYFIVGDDSDWITESGSTARASLGLPAAGVDSTAIHDNVADEFVTAGEETSPVGADRILIEDSTDSWAKKYIQITNLPAGSHTLDGGQSDVTITTPADNEVLAYNGVDTWINQTPSEAGLVALADYNAQTVLLATSDDTPVAVTVNEQTLVGRLTGGNVGLVSIGLNDNQILQVDDADNIAANDWLRATGSSGVVGMTDQATINALSGDPSIEFDWNGVDLDSIGVMWLTEQADAEADQGGDGQLWVHDDTPNNLYFTDDTGVDFQLTRNPITITWVIDGGGSSITTGEKGYLEIPFDCVLTGWTLVGDSTSGTIVIDVWGGAYADVPLDNTDAMPGSGKEPTLTTQQKNYDDTITDWTDYTLTADDCLAFNVDTSSGTTPHTRVTLSISGYKI